jgi:Zn-finger nucleic acid-binding protein
MEKKTIVDIAIDECRECRGLWFDAGEIDAVKDKLAPPELHWADFALWRKQADFEITQDPLACPRCPDATLTTITDKETPTVVRFCPGCRGAWMTAEDFNGIVDALLSELDSRTAAAYLQESLKQASVLIATKEDPITDWKDLKAILRLLKYRFFVENPKLDAIMKAFQKSMPL